MTDRELLEKAARAAGITLKPFEVKNVDGFGTDSFVGFMTEPDQWPRGWFNPLDSNDDALRLAVKLHLHLGIESDAVSAWQPSVPACWASEATGADPSAATRRAIVGAAARLTQIRERRAAAGLDAQERGASNTLGRCLSARALRWRSDP